MTTTNIRGNRLVIPHKPPSNSAEEKENWDALERWGNSQVVNQILGPSVTSIPLALGKGAQGTGIVTIPTAAPGVTQITSNDTSIAVTNPAGPSVDLAVLCGGNSSTLGTGSGFTIPVALTVWTTLNKVVLPGAHRFNGATVINVVLLTVTINNTTVASSSTVVAQTQYHSNSARIARQSITVPGSSLAPITLVGFSSSPRTESIDVAFSSSVNPGVIAQDPYLTLYGVEPD